MEKWKTDFIGKAAFAANEAGHCFPEMAACEAALESRFGTSALAIADNNLFGMKQHSHPIYGTAVLPTREFINGNWIATTSSWVKYPDWRSCFQDRLNTLQRLSHAYPEYGAALEAKTPEDYVTHVSKTWSTDPNRAKNIIDIYNEYLESKP